MPFETRPLLAAAVGAAVGGACVYGMMKKRAAEQQAPENATTVAPPHTVRILDHMAESV